MRKGVGESSGMAIWAQLVHRDVGLKLSLPTSACAQQGVQVKINHFVSLVLNDEPQAVRSFVIASPSASSAQH